MSKPQLDPRLERTSPSHGAVSIGELLRPPQLSTEQRAKWAALCADHREFDRPFFTLEYCLAFAECFDDVRVATLVDGGQLVGFFPFRSTPSHVARPIGGRLADFQGPVLPAQYTFDAPRLLRECGLSVWTFDHRLVRREDEIGGAAACAPSPVADLTEGFDAFWEQHRSAGAGWVKQIPRKRRKLGREIGEVRFEYDCRDRQVFQQLRKWKADHRRRTHTIDPLDSGQLNSAVERIFQTHEPQFAGVLSAIYAGPHLVAAHLGMRTATTFHIWFPAYDPKFESYSPGMVMFIDLFRAAAEEGIERVDFGKGPSRYKQSLHTENVYVLEGCVDVRPLRSAITSALTSCRVWARQSPIAGVVQGPKRRLLRWLHRFRERPRRDRAGDGS